MREREGVRGLSASALLSGQSAIVYVEALVGYDALLVGCLMAFDEVVAAPEGAEWLTEKRLAAAVTV